MNRQTKQDLKDACFAKNPVLLQGAAITLLVMGSSSLSLAGVASLGMALTILPALLSCGILAAKLPRVLLLPVYTLMNAVAYIPVYLLLSAVFPVQVDALGSYLPLTVVCGVGLFFLEEQGKARPFLTLPARLLQALSFPVLLCAAAFLRERIGDQLAHSSGMESAAAALFLPFVGFLLLGFVVASLQALHMGIGWALKLNARRQGTRLPGKADPDRTVIY